MKISGGNEARGIRSSSPKRKADKASGAGFAGHLSGNSAPASTDAATGPASVASLLAVQATGDALEGRRQALDRGEGLLQRMEAIQLALLEGRLDDDALQRLAAELERQNTGSGDPDLSELIAEIELRAAVELAKRGLNIK
ncbi:MAG: flagellar assembly protein FliX [Alphaproteobacteria bacterium]